MVVGTCAADTSAAVDHHGRPPGGSGPARAQALDGRLLPLLHVLAEIQHGRRTLGHSEVRPADVEVVRDLPLLTGLTHTQD